ncbi:phage tail protein [Citrobacter freundii]|nr:phage tail protein [Citrobacter freundii]
MSAKFYTLLTDIGAAKLASAAALGIPLKITHMAVGDGGGALPTPSAQQTALVAEKRRAALNMLYIDPQNSSQIIAEQVIPETEGGWWIREVGLFDENGALIAVGNCPESYKPQLVEGSGRTQTVRMVLITSSTDNIILKIDPAVVLATRKYVDDKVLELKVYVDDLMAKHLAAADPHTQYAPKASPTFIGTPKAPTAAAGNNSMQLANTAFVQAAIAALVASSPAALDTLNELAAALGNDPNFATTMTNALAGKMDKAANGKDIADVSEFLKNLGLGELALAGTITGVFDTNGYLKIPVIIGGAKRTLMVQWGNAGNAASATTETFYPVPFPNKVFQVITCGFQVGGNQQAYVTVNSSNPLNRFAWNGFYANGGQAPILSTVANQVGCQYIVIGW